ncbi:MAG: tRNA epoxyqueuosine(34) reductase QueG [Flavobacteriales bacterium]|nr:tRNA epoxyqueuosine(34) reductase QueG [Flavobacteriales bacterium]
MISRQKHTEIVKQLASEYGFLQCGISKAAFLEEEAPKLEQWLNANYHGKMAYMANHFDKRLDPTKLVEGAKSVISLLYNYYPIQEQRTDTYKISKYAYGEDYHFVIKDKLKELVFQLEEQIGEINGRIFVDSAPVMDKVWAEKSGLGWIGKHTNLINPKEGSFFFIAEIISDLDLVPDGPIKDYCGTCTKCIDACPTEAIVAPYVLDGSKCISYFTIELKDEIPNDVKGKFEDWVFGCDICQDVCPWNRFSKGHQEPLFEAKENLLEMSKEDWAQLDEDHFKKVFKKSAVKRTKYSGLMRNIEFVKG